jgi:deoxycytidine triphosphate deaminase
MYLTDAEIRDRLSDLGIVGENPDFPFEADQQIQPSSIDLRLSPVVWRPTRRSLFLQRIARRRKAVDLRRAALNELAPRRGWRRIELEKGESVVLRSREMLSGRVYERLAIPEDCAGKIEGRSSYARLGLSVHCTGDFINPGWSGFMPLQIVNLGPFPIRIVPYLPLCQLMLIQLKSRPTRVYGDETLASKYVNDDGGPSYWWRDRQITELHRKLGSVDVGLNVQNRIIGIVRFEEPDVLERLEKLVASKRVGEVGDADALLQEFATREDRRRWWDRIACLPFPVLFATSLGALTQHPVTLVYWLIWIATAMAFPLSVYTFFFRPQHYLGHQELRQRNVPD